MPRLRSETIGTGDQSWLGSTHGVPNSRSVAPDPALFTLAAYPLGVRSGQPLGEVTATGLYGPYTGDSTDEVQTVTEGGSGLVSFTLAHAGTPTGAIPVAASAASVQATLEALPGIDPGDVVVTGAAGGPYAVTFGGRLANTDVPPLVATPTGGTGTVTVATITAGGADSSADGRQVLAGFLLTDQPVPVSGGWPMLDHGRVRVDRLPVVFAETGHDTTGQFVFVTGPGA